MTIDELIKLPEGKTLEFKRDTSALKKIMKTIVAFANTAGGTLVIGREDDGEIVGVNDPLQVEEQLTSSIADSIAPLIMPDIEIVSIEGKALLCVQVTRWPGPFYIQNEDDEHGVYIRLGSSTRRAGSEFIAEIKRNSLGFSFDSLPRPELTIEHLDLAIIEQAFQLTDREITEEKLVSLRVLVPYRTQMVPSNGGLILFGTKQSREYYFPDARVSCALFDGTEKVHFLDRLDIEGGVFAALTEVHKFIRRNSRLAAQIETFTRKDIPAYSDIALREVLINAIAHTDYSLKGMRITIALFSDRLEVQSPGILPFGMTFNSFKAGTSMVRNRTVANVLRHLSLMEEWGSGYKRITAACSASGYAIPEWSESGPTVRVVLKPHPLTLHSLPATRTIDVPANVPVNVPINKRQQWFLNQLQQGIRCKPANLATTWGVVEKTAKRDIGDLQKKGIVVFIGAPKTGHYKLIKSEDD